MSKKTKTIHVPILARVEGGGALHIEIDKNVIKTLELQIYEPPRMFETFLEGRSYSDVLDMVARICGICPVAYQMSAAHAIEQCFEIKISPWVRTMRRLFYCGEWLESHSLHIHFLAAPDFLGFSSALDMAKVYPEEVHRGLRLQAFGNKLISLFGGRSVHPVGACVGGFYKAPSLQSIQSILEEIPDRIQDCEKLLNWVASLSLGSHEQPFESISLGQGGEYPMNEGRIISNEGLDLPIEAFESRFKEKQVPYSNALHCLLDGKPYLVGPLARVNNNFDLLPKIIQEALVRLNIQFPSQNMFHSMIARAIEIYFCVLEAQKLLSNYSKPSKPFSAVTPKAGQGFGCTEAPRGLLWHKYQFNEEGSVTSARIVPPTSQNQARIEADLRHSLEAFGLNQPDQTLRAYSEKIIRNYDPCISCATHFLRLKLYGV